MSKFAAQYDDEEIVDAPDGAEVEESGLPTLEQLAAVANSERRNAIPYREAEFDPANSNGHLDRIPNLPEIRPEDLVNPPTEPLPILNSNFAAPAEDDEFQIPFAEETELASASETLALMAQRNEFATQEDDSFPEELIGIEAPSNSGIMRLTDEEEDLLEGYDIDHIISEAIEKGASDVHIIPAQPLAYTLNGNVFTVDDRIISSDITTLLQQKIITHQSESVFVENWELDTSYVVRKGAHMGRRVRLSVGREEAGVYMTMRVIADQIPTPEMLKIEPEMLEWVNFPKGLIMINGATGTGKSNTLAAMIRKIQTEQRKKIITIEKPIEFLYPYHPNSIVVQREVGRDTLSYSHALDSAMRQAPNVLLVGETRNATETDALLYAADTGHLAMSTMHTNSAPETLQRIMRMYKGEEQLQVLSSLSELARGFANQVLLASRDPRTEGGPRFAVREILTVDEEVEDLILAGDVKGLRAYQMDLEKSMEHGLIRAVRDGRATLEEARSKTTRPLVFDKLVRPEDTRSAPVRPF